MFIITETPLEASFYGFYKDKQAYCDSLKFIRKTIEYVNNIADNSLQKADEA